MMEQIFSAPLSPISKFDCSSPLQTIVAPNMATFPTPPSSSGDSPQPIYFVASPNSNSFTSPESSQHYIQAQVLPSDCHMIKLTNGNLDNAPRLSIVEEPTNKFRFRYKSEMAGTHGSLCGMNSDKARKQTFPAVELHNFPGKAVIRCSIYQYNVTDDFKPHPHRLIMKRGKEEFDDPHDIVVSPNAEDGFIARFHSMGIIHTARKNIVGELVRKKSQLKRELIATLEGNMRDLTIKEITEIKGLAEQESKSINLNIVCLRFDAFLIKNGIRNPICPPVFSHGINNLKCALTGDLKIVRMDHCTSPARGGKEVFLLVERVTKKNIKIRFFELDDDEQEVWEGWGRFSELDVHHQYAIVLKTPPYDRDPCISHPVQVFMELVRPSDNARSEWKEFRFVPNNEFKPGSKRPRSSYESSSSYNSGSVCSSELPATIPNSVAAMHVHQHSASSLPSANSWNQNELFTDDQLERALSDMDSDEFDYLFGMFESVLPNDVNTMDGPSGISDRLNHMHIDKNGSPIIRVDCQMEAPHRLEKRAVLNDYNALNQMQSHERTNAPTVIKLEVAHTDIKKAERTYNELRSFIKTSDAHQRAPEILEHHFGEEVGKERRNNALHVFVSLNRKDEVTFILKMFVLSRKFKLTNVPNADNLTPLHIAVQCRNEEFVSYLLHCQANPMKQDSNGKTALHTAIKCSSTLDMLELLLRDKQCKDLIDLEDYDGYSPLNMAVENRNMTAIKLLCQNGADVNKRHQKNGFTPLRIAIENQYVEAIQYLLQHAMFEYELQNDFKNLSPFEAATIKKCNSEVMDVINRYMNDNSKSVKFELKKEIEDDDEEDEEIEEDIEMRSETTCPVFSPDQLYTGLKLLPARCLDEVSALLDESGKYLELADLLDLSHLLQTGAISSDRSISRNLLQYAIERDNVKILDIRTFLENLDEHKAVAVMDRTANDLLLLSRS
ncbi:nuclear factor NF-kappa-B p110 subunit isoform X1 [Euwallacea similis]|uniref:nuclear factor NF-kappa-B p110 subunit isoform X1 n=2 Tax=Euwallacea similis TaxID=1736056 RepID=UPI00344E5DE2